MNFLNSQFNEEGRYYIPGLPQGASMDYYTKLTESSAGKPGLLLPITNRLIPTWQ